jgi:hypothetical protein
VQARVIFGRMSVVLAIFVPSGLSYSMLGGSGSGTRTRDTAIMSRLLYRLSYPARASAPGHPDGRCAAAPESMSEPPCGIEPQTFSLPWRRSAD